LALLALGVSAAAVPAMAQRVSVTTSDAVKLVVVPFSRGDRDSVMSVVVANGIRDRLTIAYAQRFNVVSKRVIDTNLVSSGFPVDMPLDPAMARQLARLLNARLLVEGIILATTDDSVEVVGRLSEIVGQLPQTASANVRLERRRVNAGTGSELANRLADAYRSFGDTKECDARRQANEYDRALVAARAAIQRYPQSSQAFLCMARVMQAQRAPADTIIRLLELARASDSLNVTAMWQLARYYEERADTVRLIRALRNILNADFGNTEVRISLARLLTNRGHADSAVAVIDSSLTRNPNQAQLLVARSVVLAGQQRWADAGADLARAAEADTNVVDSAFVVRITQIFSQAADTTSLIRWVRVGTQRQPTYPGYWYQLAALLRARNDTTGAVESVLGYLRLLPNDGRGNIFLSSLLLAQGQLDSAVARAVTAGQADSMLRGTAAQVLFAVGARKLQAQDYAAAADLLVRAKDWATSASARTREQIAFYLGVAQYQLAVAADSVATAANARDQAQARCDAARREAGLIDEAEANVTAGGRTNPETAQQLLTQAIPAYRGRAQGYLRQARCPSQ
jgi:lipopolysaccharide biosynthesis regulator YciM